MNRSIALLLLMVFLALPVALKGEVKEDIEVKPPRSMVILDVRIANSDYHINQILYTVIDLENDEMVMLRYGFSKLVKVIRTGIRIDRNLQRQFFLNGSPLSGDKGGGGTVGTDD